jgi:hypothetical protein
MRKSKLAGHQIGMYLQKVLYTSSSHMFEGKEGKRNRHESIILIGFVYLLKMSSTNSLVIIRCGLVGFTFGRWYSRALMA